MFWKGSLIYNNNNNNHNNNSLQIPLSAKFNIVIQGGDIATTDNLTLTADTFWPCHNEMNVSFSWKCYNDKHFCTSANFV
jgi:hypothetical protein